jgi:Pro-Pro endopeptidase
MMKKLLVFSIILLLIAPIKEREHTKASPFGIPLNEYQSMTFYMNQVNLENKELLGELILLPEGRFNELEAIEMIKRLDLIHPQLIDLLVNNNIHIKFFAGQLTDEPTAAHLKGIKPRGYSEDGPLWDDVPGIGGSKLVLAKIGHSEKGMGHGAINLELHELAHTIDKYIYYGVRYDQEFQRIWGAETEALFPNNPYLNNYPEEYFAEVFAYYYLSPVSRSFLMQKAPLTYRYLVQLEQRLVNPIVDLTAYH